MYTRPNQTHTHVSGLNVLFDVRRYAQVMYEEWEKKHGCKNAFLYQVHVHTLSHARHMGGLAFDLGGSAPPLISNWSPR